MISNADAGVVNSNLLLHNIEQEGVKRIVFAGAGKAAEFANLVLQKTST